MRRTTKRLVCVLAVWMLAPYLFAQEHVVATATTHSATLGSAVPAEKIWADLMVGNHRFVTNKPRVREFVQLRHALTKGQHPQTVVLTCSDSRVPPELLFDQSLGSLFVVRTAGNVADAVGRGSIEYAVEHLGASVLVVLGHEKCGAVTAACSGDKTGSPNLEAILDQISPAVSKAKGYAAADAVVESAIRENVHQSATDILERSEVLRHAMKDGKLTVIEALYKLESGEVDRVGKLAVVEPAAKLDIGDVVRVE